MFYTMYMFIHNLTVLSKAMTTSLGIRLGHLALGSGLGALSTYLFIYDKSKEDLTCEFKFGMPEPSLRILRKDGVTISYDATRKTPLWVAEHITAKNLDGAADRSNAKFECDSSLPEHQRAGNDDFMRTGWTRGHMAAAGNYKHSQNQMNCTFNLSNIVPQEYENNSGYWYMLETYCRELAKRFKHVYIFSGPVWLPVEEVGDRFSKQIVKYQVIGEKRVSVPTHLYKLIIAEDGSSKPKVSAFVVPNGPISFKTPLKSFQVTPIQLQEMIGMNLTPKISNNTSLDLCEKETECKLGDLAAFTQFKYLRDINGDRNIHFVNRTWSRIEREGLDNNPVLREAYFNKIKQLFTQEKKTEQNNP